MSEIKSGQIWREVDPRFTRHIRVRFVCVGGTRVAIETVIRKRNGVWVGKRHQEASAARFNGKRGGYALHEDVKALSQQTNEGEGRC